MFEKLKENHYVREYLWEDVKNLTIVLILGGIMGSAITLLAYHPYIL